MSNLEDPLKKIETISKQLQTSPENLLREELQKCILFLLSGMGFFQSGVFQGGTALRIVYHNFRFSEDLDFVFQSKDSLQFQSIEKKIDRIPKELNKWFPFLSISTGKWQKRSPILNRYQFKVQHPSLQAVLLLQLEFANIPSYFNQLAPLQYEIYPFTIRVETEEEILLDKVIAFGLRSYLKGRDLWDLYFLVVLHKITLVPSILFPSIQKKSQDYGFEVQSFQVKFLQNLDILKQKGELILKLEMKRFLDTRLYLSYLPEFEEINKKIVQYLESIDFRES